MNTMKILLGEDDLDDREIFAYFLEGREGLELMKCVENGIQVLGFLAELADGSEMPDLILLDHNMPKMNGSETLKLLKSNPAYASIPVFVYSTHTDKLLVDNYIRSGAAIVYPKPITKEGYSMMLDTFVEAIHAAQNQSTNELLNLS